MRCIECDKDASVVYHGFSFCDIHLEEYLHDIKPIKLPKEPPIKTIESELCKMKFGAKYK